MKITSYSSYVEGKFSVRVAEVEGKKWYVARDIVKALGINASITSLMTRIPSFFQLRCTVGSHGRMYLLSEEGCRALVKLYKTSSSSELESFMNERLFVKPAAPKAVAPAAPAAPAVSLEETEEFQALKSMVETNDARMTKIQESLETLIKMIAERNTLSVVAEEDKAEEAPLICEDLDKVFVCPADRDDWRKWANLMVSRMSIKHGGNVKSAACHIWDALVTPIEKEFGVNFWALVNEANKLRGKKSKHSPANRISVINSDDEWMRMLIDNIVTMAENAGVSTEIPGIPMSTVTIKQKASA